MRQSRSKSIKLREKGQVTIPADILKVLGWDPGAQLSLIRRGNAISIELPEAVVERSFGVLAELADPDALTKSIDQIIDGEDAALEAAIVEEHDQDQKELEKDVRPRIAAIGK